MFKNISVYILSLCMLLSVFAITGCDSSSGSTSSSIEQTTTSVAENPLYAGIEDAIKATAKADKTNDIKDELRKYPDYYVKGEYGTVKEFEKSIKENFYKCDTEYVINSIEDVTSQYEKSIEKELKDYYDADVDIEGVAKVNASYRYYNYNDDQHLDQTDLIPSDEYYIKIDGLWYYGWNLEINATEVSDLSELG